MSSDFLQKKDVSRNFHSRKRISRKDVPRRKNARAKTVDFFMLLRYHKKRKKGKRRTSKSLRFCKGKKTDKAAPLFCKFCTFCGI